MNNIFFKTSLIITIAQLFLFGSCNKNDTRPCQSGVYSFVVQSEWTPQRESYNIGDTIYLHSTFPKTLLDQAGGTKMVDYSNAVGIGGAGNLYELDTITHQVKGGTEKFDFLSVIGNIGNDVIIPTQSKSLHYAELPTAYSLKVAIIPKRKGLFCFFIPDLSSAGIRGKDCTNAGFENTLTNTNKNINLFQYALGHAPVSQFEIDRVFCFRVQ